MFLNVEFCCSPSCGLCWTTSSECNLSELLVPWNLLCFPADVVESDAADPGSCMAAGSTSGSSSHISGLWSCGWPTEAWRLGVSPPAFVQHLRGRDLTRTTGAGADDLQYKPAFLIPQEDDYPGHPLQLNDTTASFNTSNHLVCPSAN